MRGTTKGYVVLEGNRRVASVKTLQQQIDEDELQISNAAKKSLREIPAVVYHGNNPDIAWLVQGLRHFSASPIKRWEPIQQARFIEKTAEQSGAEEIKIGKQFGVKPRETAKLIDALHLFRQAKAHRDYGDSIDDSKFTMFHDGIFDKREALATEFLGYNEDAKKATNEANFSRFLALITSSGSKGTSTIRRAIDVRDKLPKIILEKDVLDRLVDGEIDLDEAYQEIISRTKSRESGKFSPEEELKSLQASLDRITKLPSTAISMNGDVKGQFVDLLRKIQRIVKAHLEMLD